MGALQALCPKTMYSDSKEWYLDAYVSRVSGDGKGNFQIRRKASVGAEKEERRCINRIPTGIGWDSLEGRMLSLSFRLRITQSSRGEVVWRPRTADQDFAVLELAGRAAKAILIALDGSFIN